MTGVDAWWLPCGGGGGGEERRWSQLTLQTADSEAAIAGE